MCLRQSRRNVPFQNIQKYEIHKQIDQKIEKIRISQTYQYFLLMLYDFRWKLSSLDNSRPLNGLVNNGSNCICAPFCLQLSVVALRIPQVLPWGRFWSTFGYFWATFGRFWQIFGSLLIDFGRSWAPLGRSWAPLGAAVRPLAILLLLLLLPGRPAGPPSHPPPWPAGRPAGRKVLADLYDGIHQDHYI